MDKKLEKEITRFFKALFRECNEGSIRIQFRPSNKKKYIPLKEINKIPGILDADKGREDDCFGVATRMEEEDKQDKIAQIPAVWVKLTIDYEEDPLPKLEDEGLIPSVIVDSPERMFFWILK